MYTITAQIVNAQTKAKEPNVELELLDLAANSNIPLQSVTSDASGDAVFHSVPAGEYALRQVSDFGADFKVCGQKVMVDSDVTLTLDADPVLPLTKAEKQTLIAAYLEVFAEIYKEQIAAAGGDATREEAANNEVVSSMAFLKAFIKDEKIQPNPGETVQWNVSCSTCNSLCATSTNPTQCLKDCRYGPPPCYNQGCSQ